MDRQTDPKTAMLEMKQKEMMCADILRIWIM